MSEGEKTVDETQTEIVHKLGKQVHAYRIIAHEAGVRSGWLQPANGSSWAVLDKAANELMETLK